MAADTGWSKTCRSDGCTPPLQHSAADDFHRFNLLGVGNSHAWCVLLTTALGKYLLKMSGLPLRTRRVMETSSSTECVLLFNNCHRDTPLQLEVRMRYCHYFIYIIHEGHPKLFEL